MSSELKNIVEAVLMVSESPVTVSRIQGLFKRGAQPSAEEVKQAIEVLQQDCQDRAVEVCKVGSGYRYQTREKYAEWIRKLQTARPPRMSRALLETLAIIAYRQPVTRGDIEEIRGVTVSTEIMQRLTEREWVKEVGVRDVPGHPTLFGTTPEFLSYFNLEALKDLPPLMEERELGQIASEMDTPLPPEVLAGLQNPAQQDVFDSEADTNLDNKSNGNSNSTESEGEGEDNTLDDSTVEESATLDLEPVMESPQAESARKLLTES